MNDAPVVPASTADGLRIPKRTLKISKNMRKEVESGGAANRFPGGLRTGKQFLDSIAADGRQVFIDGAPVQDVTVDDAFSGGARTIGKLFDISSDPMNRELMTFTSPTSGKPVNRIWQMPESKEQLYQRREAIQRWSEETVGFMGRTPDHVAGFFVGYASQPDVLARNGAAELAARATRFLEFMRDNDVYITYTIVPPQIDRSKPAHQQEPPDLYAGVVDENSNGIVIRGAQMLGTGTVYSDYVQLSTIHPMRPGDEAYAINVAIPCNAQGVKIYSRRSYGRAASSVYDYPLASRFDESDSLLVYEDVFVPWENVFVYRDTEICRAQWFETPSHVIGNNQAQIRFATKLRFLVGLAKKIAGMNGLDNLPPVQALIAEIAMHAATYEGLVEAQIEKAEPNEHGYYIPDAQCVYAAMMQQSRIYPVVLNLLRELCGSGLIQLPSNVADFENPEMAADITRYIQSPDYSADERVKLMKLAWDAIGSEFAGRHESYEKFYAGAPFIVSNHLYRNYNFDKSIELVEKTMAGYGQQGVVD